MAAYQGEDSAAPVLLEMLERGEGCAGAFYSGLATVDGSGRLHYLKCVGSAIELRRMGAEALPGRIGIIHGRPPLGGGKEWAHPFVSQCGQAALAANGHSGFFDRPDLREADLEMLERDGFEFLSRDKASMPEYRPDPTGSVHGCELDMRRIEKLFGEVKDWHAALTKLCHERPSETAGLLLVGGDVPAVLAYRISQPLFVGYTKDAAFASTTSLVFPDRASMWQAPLPAPAVFRLQKDQHIAQPLWPGREVPVRQQLPWLAAEKRIRKYLAEGAQACIQDLKDLTADLWVDDKAPQKDFLVYSIVQAMVAKDELVVTQRLRPGAAPECIAPETLFSLKKVEGDSCAKKEGGLD